MRSEGCPKSNKDGYFVSQRSTERAFLAERLTNSVQAPRRSSLTKTSPGVCVLDESFKSCPETEQMPRYEKSRTAGHSLKGQLQPRRDASRQRNCRPGEQTREVDHVHVICFNE